MASLRLTIRLKTSDESEAWRTAAESQGYSTLNKFIRTVVNKSILDLNANRDEFYKIYTGTKLEKSTKWWNDRTLFADERWA